jgi:uncharacterized low-complexity protein
MIKKQLITGITLALTAVSGIAQANENPFAATQLTTGYQVAQADTKSAEGKCGAKETDGKKAEGKCGAKETDSKKAEGKCGEGKCGDKK